MKTAKKERNGPKRGEALKNIIHIYIYSIYIIYVHTDSSSYQIQYFKLSFVQFHL